MRNVMMRNIYLKTLYDKRAFIFGWSLGMAFIAFLMTVFYPAFQQDNGIDQLLEALPPAFQGLVGDLANLKQLSTYLGAQLFEIRMPIFLSVMTIILALGLTVSEEDRGELRTLLASTPSRGRILIEKWLAAVTITLLTTLGALAGIGLGFISIGESTDFDVLVRLVSLMWLLAIAMVSLVMAVGLASGKRSLTNGFAVIVMIGSFLLTTFAQAVDWLEPYKVLSIFTYYPAPDIATGTVEPGNVLFYAVIVVVSLVSGWFFFRRRDVQ